ncbi:Aste57867_20540 [Aphanomyces stellatus]|uniref:Aste57867_20540 protein n=1 Tax=Aphanomyces stellatus TaxID=120398 RepID=A0A485LH83_9STRA|nr:hypothetical protein As57867_020473 [Aphanomyces stellatus]VFT97225.1 Aste57867_20540 [Aphanomyces stellatus]
MNLATRKRVLDVPSRMLFDGGMRSASPPQQAHTVRDVMSTKHLEAKLPESKEAQDLLKSQELFLSVVLDWQKHDHSDSSVHDDSTQSDHVYTSSCSEGSDHEGGAATRLMSFTRTARSSKQTPADDPSPTNLPKIHNIPPSNPLPALNLNNLLPVPTKRIGIYSPRSRRVLLEKYMEKRTKRLSRKKVRYRVRKTLANARPRVKGRFVKTEQPLTAAAVEEMEKKRTTSPPPPSMMMIGGGDGDFDLCRVFYDCERGVRADVQDVMTAIVTAKRRKNEEINWEEWAGQLEQAIVALLPSQYVDSPFPDVFSDLGNILGDAEEECSAESYTKALHAGAVYVVICLSLYISLRHPSLWENEDDVSPVLRHYVGDIKALWTRRKTKKSQTYECLEGAIPGIAAVICLGYDDGKRYLKHLFH